ncbi:ester cyclase [Streptomyces ficellus]|uniref:Ester cyclase n=1 Tax=Streptomyces ficellus TaxID=1977088 RepID=A0A6I6F9Q2_9ACTN|nr:ester cyclase [Streptomyces ficellus]QGV77647.1 ester cyclase [Streptomyces ficellus]
MTFVQIIDCKTDRVEEMNRLLDSWAEATQGKRTATHAMMGRDRSDSTHVLEIVEFPSYEEAMENSRLPETNRIFQEMTALCDGEPTFTDLDVVRDEQLNKLVVQRFVDQVINQANASAADELCTAGYREHDPGNSSYDVDLETAKNETREIMEAFEPRCTIEGLVAEGDTVCCRMSFTGRHVGAYRGIEATGRELAITGHATFRCEGGRIAESWWNVDEMGLMRQLGVVSEG